MRDPVELAEEGIAWDALQKPGEFACLIAIVQTLGPNPVIVEIGCDAGGALYVWRELSNRVIAIDLPRADFSSGKRLEQHGAPVIIGDSHDPSNLELLKENLPDPIDFLFVDGDHTYEGVKRDWDMYSPLVRKGGIVALHDVCPSAEPKCKVDVFWKELDYRHKVSLISEPTNCGGIGIVWVE